MPRWNRFLTLAAMAALLVAPGLARAGRITRIECGRTEGGRTVCDDGRIGMCQDGRAYANLWVDETGYYMLRTTLFTNDSGDHQRNEAFVILIRNSRKPEGFPLDGNCQRYRVIPDGVQDRIGELGVYYLVAGEANEMEVTHYCRLWSDDICTQFYDPGGEGGGGCRNCESLGFELDGISVTPENPCEYGTNDYEWCDGYDNDCDGHTDEDQDGDGADACEDCEPDDPARYPGAPEYCDGQDNDCDGEVDEGVTNACGGCDPLPGEPGGLCGECGAWVCDGLNALSCADTGPNVCGGCGPLEGLPDAPCGECGQHRCTEEGALECLDPGFNACGDCGTVPTETCDGLDNDCDGVTDEIASAEVCNCVDDDCNGETDEGNICPPGQVCTDCACATPCAAGECPEGTQCWDGYCRGLPCPEEPCPEGWTCQDGQRCLDPCVALDCPAGTRCEAGACQDTSCYTLGCPTGLLCRDGDCVQDPCAGADCPLGTWCRDGECVPSCAGVRCPEGQSCEDGVCVEDPCSGARCADGRICRDGVCVWDPCADVDCPAPLVCVEGACEGDPCSGLRCPEGQLCQGGQCYAPGDPAVEDIVGSEGEGEGEGAGAEGEGEDGRGAATGEELASEGCDGCRLSSSRRLPASLLVAVGLLLGLFGLWRARGLRRAR